MYVFWSGEIFQLCAMQGFICMLSSICTSPLKIWLIAHIVAWSLANAGSSEVIPDDWLYRNMLFVVCVCFWHCVCVSSVNIVV